MGGVKFPRMHAPTITFFVVAAIELAVLVRVMLRPHREPVSRVAWVAVIVAVPLVGVCAYLFFGEVNIGRRRLEKLRAVERGAPPQFDYGPLPAGVTVG